MKHGSLFSGIGGFDLAAEWMGWENVFHCEWMPFPRKVLNYYWPNSISYENICTTDFTKHRGEIDILTGGFPCQPYSSAGKRLGKEDSRHLWPEMLRSIREIEPTYIVGENVRGLTNWGGGLVFEEVCVDLENQGYEVQPVLLPACAVGAPHRRDRIWFVAYSESRRTRGLQFSGKASGTQQSNFIFGSECGMENKKQNATNSNGFRWWNKSDRIGKSKFYGKNCKGNDWEIFPTQSPICGGDDGLPSELDGITFSKWRQESIKGYGNAIVPQVTFEIFKVIEKLNNL